MMTIFSIPKPFDGKSAVIQTNAIKSWKKINSEGEIILFGGDKGVKEIAVSENLHHIPSIKTNKQGTPLLNDAFKQAKRLSKHRLLCFTNADIIFTSSLNRAVAKMDLKAPFIMVGRRIDLDMPELIEFDSLWEERLMSLVKNASKLHGFSGIDYFIFPKTLEMELPPFAVGRAGWDNALIYTMRKNRIPIIDATEVIDAVHQNHDYNHLKGREQEVWFGNEARENVAHGGGLGKMMTILGATHILTNEGLKTPSLKRRLYGASMLFPPTRYLMQLKRLLQQKLSS